MYKKSYTADLVKIDSTNRLYEQFTVGNGVPTPTREGYDFKGWYHWKYYADSNGNPAVSQAAAGSLDLKTQTLIGPIKSGTSLILSQGTTSSLHSFCIAAWEPHKYNINYHYNNKTTTEKKTYDVDYTISSELIPTKEGCNFIGWDTSIDGKTVVYKAGDSYTTEADADLYPVWEKITYTINYNANGGLEAPNTQHTQIDDGMTIPFATPYRSGYNFFGWAKSPTSIKAEYQPGDFLPKENIDLFALWKPTIPDKGAAVSGQIEFECNNKIYEDVYINLTDNPTYVCLDLSYPEFIQYESFESVDITDEMTVYENISGGNRILNISIYNENGIEINNLTQLGRFYFNVSDNDNYGTYSMSVSQNSSFYIINGEKTTIDYTKSQTLELKPYTAQAIEIVGNTKITKPSQYTVKFTPEKTAVKTVEWTVDNESIATIDANGILTPLKNGTVTLSAKTIDGSNLIANYQVEISNQPATISNLESSIGRFTETFDPNKFVYTLLVPQDCESIELTAEFIGGTLLCDNYGFMFSNIEKTIYINSDKQELVLTRSEQDYTSANYFITIQKTDNLYGLLGDVDGDSDITIVDATIIQKALVDLPIDVNIDNDIADTDEDSFITISDATSIQRWLVELSSNDNIGKPINK